MMRVKIAELKDHLSEYLRAVEKGAEVIVTDRDRPIAHITPMPATGDTIRLLPRTRDFAAIRDRERVPASWATDSTLLLREERGER